MDSSYRNVTANTGASAENQTIPPLRSLRPQERSAALAQARLIESQRRSQASHELSEQRLEQDAEQFERTEARQNSQFEQSQQLDKSKLVLDGLSKLQQIAESRANLAHSAQVQQSTVGALRALSELNPRFDPDLDQDETDTIARFKEKYSEIQKNFPDGMAHEAVQKLAQEKADAFHNFEQAVHERLTANFFGPAMQAYEQTLKATGDTRMALARAKGVKKDMDDVRDLIANGHVSPQDVNAQTDTNTGNVNYASLLELGSRRKGEAVSTDRVAKTENDNISTLANALSKLSETGTDDETPDRKEARVAAETALKNYLQKSQKKSQRGADTPTGQPSKSLDDIFATPAGK